MQMVRYEWHAKGTVFHFFLFEQHYILYHTTEKQTLYFSKEIINAKLVWVSSSITTDPIVITNCDIVNIIHYYQKSKTGFLRLNLSFLLCNKTTIFVKVTQ